MPSMIIIICGASYGVGLVLACRDAEWVRDEDHVRDEVLVQDRDEREAVLGGDSSSILCRNGHRRRTSRCQPSTLRGDRSSRVAHSGCTGKWSAHNGFQYCGSPTSDRTHRQPCLSSTDS